MANYARLLKNLRATDNKWITLKGSEEGNGHQAILYDQGNIIGGDVPKAVQGKPISNAFGKSSPPPSHTPVAAKGKTTNIHINEHDYISQNKAKNLTEAVMNSLKVGESEANDIVYSLKVYTLSSYTRIRKAERDNTPGKHMEQSNNLSTFIDKSPQWDAPAYRGIQVDPSVADKILASKGQVIDMGGTSSWSSNKDIASDFSLQDRKTKTAVLFEVERPGRATSIKHISHMPDEDEVLVHKDQKYKIMDANGVLLVTLKAH